MTNYPIDSALAAAEGIFEIDLLNKVTGTSYPKAAVCGANTLGQVSQEYGADLGINPKDSKILFENKRTGASTSDTGETVESLGLQEGDVLAISDNAGVAYPVLPVKRSGGGNAEKAHWRRLQPLRGPSPAVRRRVCAQKSFSPLGFARQNGSHPRPGAADACFR